MLIKELKSIDRLIALCDGNFQGLFKGPLFVDSKSVVVEIVNWAYADPIDFFQCLNVRNLKALGIKRKIWLTTALQGGIPSTSAMERTIADQILNALKKAGDR